MSLNAQAFPRLLGLHFGDLLACCTLLGSGVVLDTLELLCRRKEVHQIRFAIDSAKLYTALVQRTDTLPC